MYELGDSPVGCFCSSSGKRLSMSAVPSPTLSHVSPLSSRQRVSNATLPPMARASCRLSRSRALPAVFRPAKKRPHSPPLPEHGHPGDNVQSDSRLKLKGSRHKNIIECRRRGQRQPTS